MRKVVLPEYIISLLIAYLTICALVVNADEMSAAEDRPAYIISIGDQLLISVVGHETELNASVTVRPDGMINYPVAGDVAAAGSTIMQLSSAISKQLSASGYYEEPQVTVQLKRSIQEIVYAFGDVKEPGQKGFSEPANVIQVLAAAGGYRETAALTRARIIKIRQEEVIPVDLKKLLERGIIDDADDELLADRFTLEDGDVLLIPSAVKEDRVNVIGYVHVPGQYPVQSPVKLIEVLAFAGGALEKIADLKHIRIIRSDDSVDVVDATRIWADINENNLPPNSLSHQTKNMTEAETDHDYQRMIVYPGDSVFVPEKGQINIIGNVMTQGSFAVDGEISIIEALAMGGIENDSNLKKLRIAKSTGEQITVDASKIWKQSGQDIEEKLAPGDTLIVPKAFRINWTAISTTALIFSTLYVTFK